MIELSTTNRCNKGCESMINYILLLLIFISCFLIVSRLNIKFQFDKYKNKSKSLIQTKEVQFKNFISKQIISKLFPNPLPSIADIEAKYPSRNLQAGQKVTRVAPSPTGWMHVGGIYAGLISERISHQSGRLQRCPRL